MVEEKCCNCRNREGRPYYYYDYCPVLKEYVNPVVDDIYSMCCDCFEEDI